MIRVLAIESFVLILRCLTWDYPNSKYFKYLTVSVFTGYFIGSYFYFEFHEIISLPAFSAQALLITEDIKTNNKTKEMKEKLRLGQRVRYNTTLRRREKFVQGAHPHSSHTLKTWEPVIMDLVSILFSFWAYQLNMSGVFLMAFNTEEFDKLKKQQQTQPIKQ